MVKIIEPIVAYIVSRSQALFFLLCKGGERKGPGEHGIASSLAYPEIVGIQLRSFRIVCGCE